MAGDLGDEERLMIGVKKVLNKRTKMDRLRETELDGEIVAAAIVAVETFVCERISLL